MIWKLLLWLRPLTVGDLRADSHECQRCHAAVPGRIYRKRRLPWAER